MMHTMNQMCSNIVNINEILVSSTRDQSRLDWHWFVAVLGFWEFDLMMGWCNLLLNVAAGHTELRSNLASYTRVHLPTPWAGRGIPSIGEITVLRVCCVAMYFIPCHYSLWVHNICYQAGPGFFHGEHPAGWESRERYISRYYNERIFTLAEFSRFCFLIGWPVTKPLKLHEISCHDMPGRKAQLRLF